MRIGLYSGTTLYPLAGAAGVSERLHSGAADFQLTPESEKQIAAYVRGEYAKPIDRGNLLNSLAFSTSRQLATPAEAQLWCLDYAVNFASSGELVFEAIAPDGSSTWRRMRNTVVDPPTRRCNGATALLDYRAQGGEIEAFAPNAVISGVATAGVNGVLIPAGTVSGRPAWSKLGTLAETSGNILLYSTSDPFWVLRDPSGVYEVNISSSALLPFGLTGGILVAGSGLPTISVGLPS